MNDITKKLQKLVKIRKTQVVVIKKGSVKHYNRSTSSDSDYYSDGSENN